MALSMDTRRYRAGDTVEEPCRACKIDRLHTIIVVDQAGAPVRVQCDYCGSQHNSHLRTAAAAGPAARGADAVAAKPPRAGEPFPLVSDAERTGGTTAMTAADNEDLEMLLRRIIREEAGVTPVVPAQKWRGGSLVLKPGNPALQEKTWPIETLFHKVVMIRNRLRTLEQQVNAIDIPEDVKLKLQAYITGCYGSLSSFNLLFAEEDDQFKGTGGE